MENISFLLPEIALAGFGFFLLLADLFVPGERGRSLTQAAIAGVALALCLLGATTHAGWMGLGTLWLQDELAVFLKVLILIATFMTLWLSMDYEALPSKHMGLYSTLVLWTASGMMFLVSAIDLVMVFIALELVSLASFILTGFVYRDEKSSEGAMKYFLIGAFSSAVTVYGISLFYGYAGTTLLTDVVPEMDPLFAAGVLFMLVGFGFKASLAPFHTWVPDAYQGAPTPITAFLSVAPKVAVMGLLLRFFTIVLEPVSAGFATVLSALAMLTMTVGNLGAIFQTNVKRLLAYSSIAQAGYIFMGVAVGGSYGQQGVLLYSLVYLFMNMGAFALAIAVARESGTEELDGFDGLGQRSFAWALLMVFFMLSLAGIPPLAGFIAKFYIFAAAVERGFITLAVVGAVNSVVAFYYYAKIMYHMFFKEPQTKTPLAPGYYAVFGIGFAAVVIVLVGLFPNNSIEWVRISMP